MKKSILKIIILFLSITNHLFANEFQNIDTIIKQNSNEYDSPCDSWIKNKDEVYNELKKIRNKLQSKFNDEFVNYLNKDPRRYFAAFYIFENDVLIKKDYYALFLFEEGLIKAQKQNDWRLNAEAMTARIIAVVVYAKIGNNSKASYHKTIAEELMSKDDLLSGCRPAEDNEFWEIYNSIDYKKPDIQEKKIVYSKNKNEAILEAARNGDFFKIKELINNGADINAHYSTGMNVFMTLNSDDQEVIEYCYNKGANIHAKDIISRTALMFAAQNNSMTMIKFLINKKIDINEKDNNGRTAIFYAAIGGNLDCIIVLVNNGADINIKDNLAKLHLIMLNYKNISKLLSI